MAVLQIQNLIEELLIKDEDPMIKSNGKTMRIDADGKLKSANLFNGLSQMMPLFKKPLVNYFLLVLALQFCVLGG